jgi:hypothetical protein
MKHTNGETTDLLGFLLFDEHTAGMRFGRHRTILADIVREISVRIGYRPAGSINETKAAAYLSTLWQKADILHWTDTFQARTHLANGLSLLTLLSVLSFLLMFVDITVALLIGSIGLVSALTIMYFDVPILSQGRGMSQNVIAVRKPAHEARRRVVFVAPIDTVSSPVRFGSGSRGVVFLTIQLALLLLVLLDPFPVVDLLAGMVIWLTIIPVGYFCVANIVDAFTRRQQSTKGAVSHAGALAVMAGSMDELEDIQHTELWAVGIGASATHSGIDDLLNRYPFDAQSTFFISLAGLGHGTLCYALQQGYDRGRSIDPLLLELAAEMGTSMNLVAKVSRQPSIVRLLLRRQYRAIEFTCLGEDGFVPLQGTKRDTLEVVSMPLLERAVRVCTMMVRAVDSLN